MVEHQVDGGAGDDGGELLQQLDRLEEQMGGAIAPQRLECDEDAAVGPELDAVLGERGAEEVAAEPFEAGAIVGGRPRRWRGDRSRRAGPGGGRGRWRDRGPARRRGGGRGRRRGGRGRRGPGRRRRRGRPGPGRLR